MNKTKKVIFDAAIKAFSEKGYHKATMDEVAKTAGVAKGTLYYHFKSKEDIFNFIIDEGIKIIKEEINDKTMFLEDPNEKFRKICEVQINLIIEYLPFFKTIFSQIWGDEERQSNLRNKLDDYQRLIESYVLEAADSKFINEKNVEIIGFNFIGAMVSTIVYIIINKNNDVNKEMLLETLVEFLIRGIGNK